MPTIADFTSDAQLQALADARGWTDGLALARSGAVQLESVGSERVVASVNAPDGAARVELTAGERFGFACSCTDLPEACRHIVATALALPGRAAPR